MKKQIRKKIMVICFITIQIISLRYMGGTQKAKTKEGYLIAEHECVTLLKTYKEALGKWYEKPVHYICYQNAKGERKPVFLIKANQMDEGMWRIMHKGFRGSSYEDWKLKTEDDLYTATQIALENYEAKIAPNAQYKINDATNHGIPAIEVISRAIDVLSVAQTLYEYGIEGNETYEEPKIHIEQGKKEKKILNREEYFIQQYLLSTNKKLKSYEIQIKNFPEGTIILDSNDKNIEKKQDHYEAWEKEFQIAIPIKAIAENRTGEIEIKNANIKTDKTYQTSSILEFEQSFLTYDTDGFETTRTSTTLQIKKNQYHMLLKKVDAETKQGLAGAVFRITDENGTILGDFTTDQTGQIELRNRKEKELILQEIKAPNGYKINNNKQKITLKWGETKSIQIENQKENKQPEPKPDIESKPNPDTSTETQPKEEPKKLPRTGY